MTRKPPAPKKRYSDDSWRGRTWDEIRFGTSIYNSGEKVTQARIHVLMALSKFDRPITIKELATSSDVKDHNITTLYRTLETLVKKGLAKKLALNPTESFYEALIGRPHHHHIVCTSCGLIESVHVCAPLPSQKSLVSKGFSAVTDHSLEFFGICARCAV